MWCLSKARGLFFAMIGLLCVGVLPLSADPGKAYQSIRAALVEKHDTDGDGRLNAAEREAMRLQAKRGNGQEGRGRRGRGRWQPPKEWVERYDADGDGELSREEQGAAFMGEQRRITNKYDADGNGRIEGGEKKKIQADLEKGVFQGFDRMIAMQVGGIEGRGRRGRWGGGISESQRRWLEFDSDGDGKASRAELEAIRKAQR